MDHNSHTQMKHSFLKFYFNQISFDSQALSCPTKWNSTADIVSLTKKNEGRLRFYAALKVWVVGHCGIGYQSLLVTMKTLTFPTRRMPSSLLILLLEWPRVAKVEQLFMQFTVYHPEYHIVYRTIQQWNLLQKTGREPWLSSFSTVYFPWNIHPPKWHSN